MIIVVVASPGETGCVSVLDVWSGTSGTAAASYAMTEVSPSVYESANITGLGGEWRVRMKNAGNEPVYTGYVRFSDDEFGHATSEPGGLDAAGVRAAIGLAEANMDSQIAAVSNINVLPLNAAVQSRVRGTTIDVFSGETVLVSIAVVDAAGQAVSLTGRTLRIVLESPGSTADRTVIENGSIARSGNTVSFAIVGGSTGARRLWSLRDTSGDVVLAHGVVSTTYAPKKD